MEKTKSIIISILLAILLCFIAVDLAVWDNAWYEQQFEKNKVYATINASPEIINAQAKNILAFNQGKEALNPLLLNTKEQQHLADVKKLAIRGQQLMFILSLVVFMLIVRSSNKKKIVVQTGIIMIIGLGIVAIVPFEQLFFKMHQLLFTNNLWLLNPATDNLILMYPGPLFEALARKIASIVFIQAIGCVAIGLYKSSKKERPWQK